MESQLFILVAILQIFQQLQLQVLLLARLVQTVVN